MRKGFPSHLEINLIFDIFKQNLDNDEHSCSRKDICSSLIRSCGLKWRDFKIGHTKIFFRNGKLDSFNEKLKGDLQLIINHHKKLKLLRSKWRIVIIVARLCSTQKSRKIQNDSAPSSVVLSPKISRKRKLNTSPDNVRSSNKPLQIQPSSTLVSTQMTSIHLHV